MHKNRPPLVLAALMLPVLMVFSGCGTNYPTNVQLNEIAAMHAERSTADVLVPVDGRFRGTWDFHVLDSPNNYTYSSNAGSSGDGEVDRRLMAYGYLVNDPDTWSGGSVHGDILGIKVVHQTALAESREPAESQVCEWWDVDLGIVMCEHAEGFLAGFMTAVRRFSDVDTVMIAASPNDASFEFLYGEFEVVAIDEARSWLVDAR